MFELYHCKYSKEDTPGSRISDLYEVCGQTGKCIKWMDDVSLVIDNLIKMDQNRVKTKNSTRYDVGDNKTMHMIKCKLKMYSFEFKVFMVQPGVNGEAITQEMHQVLCCAEAYIKETYGIPLALICS